MAFTGVWLNSPVLRRLVYDFLPKLKGAFCSRLFLTGKELTVYCAVALGRWFGWFLKKELFVGDVAGELEAEPFLIPAVAALRSP